MIADELLRTDLLRMDCCGLLRIVADGLLRIFADGLLRIFADDCGLITTDGL